MPSRNLPPFKAVSIAAVALFASIMVALAPGRAAAATPCWKAVINDWEDNGRIDGTYPINCYRQALNRLPQDVQDYTSLPDDIRAAMQQALAGKNGGSQPQSRSSDTMGQGSRKPSNRASKNKYRQLQVAPPTSAFEKSLGPANTAGSVPLPLIVLASVGGLLLLSAGGAFAHKRFLAGRIRLPRLPGL
jgi:hypothetical protein